MTQIKATFNSLKNSHFSTEKNKYNEILSVRVREGGIMWIVREEVCYRSAHVSEKIALMELKS